MQQYIVVIVSFFSHNGCAYLTQAYAVSPASSGQFEPCGNVVLLRTFVYYKGGAEQVGV